MISIYRTNHHYMVEANARRSSFVIDVRYYKSNPWSCMSPFFKWGDVPVRFSAPDTAISIAAMIEGLRVNQYHEHDPNLFHSLNFSDYLESERIKDSSGFLRGIGSHVILSPEEAQKELLYPTYRWVLDHKLNNQINAIRAAESYQDVVILDYPKDKRGMELYAGEISIGYLLKAYIEGSTPYEDVFEYKEEYIYLTDYKRKSGHRIIKRRVPREIKALNTSDNQQLEIPLG